MVHYNSKYKSINEAAPNADGLAVIAVFFELAEQSKYDENINKFMKYAHFLTKPEYTYVINSKEELFNVRDVIKYQINEYYAYKGKFC